jgi:murein DD-endopeptidase MepM/ murein hydrolase activator NlpD
MSDSMIPFVPFTRTRFSLRDDAKPADDNHWFWPLPRLAGEHPQIIAHANDERLGVDLGYARFPHDGLFVPVYAVQAGTISYAARVTSGFALTIDHGGVWSTHYAHLAQMFVTPTLGRRRRRARARAGDVIGYAARAPNHVRFELWRWTSRDGFVPVRASLFMREWSTLPQLEQRAATVAHRATGDQSPNARPNRMYASATVS